MHRRSRSPGLVRCDAGACTENITLQLVDPVNLEITLGFVSILIDDNEIVVNPGAPIPALLSATAPIVAHQDVGGKVVVWEPPRRICSKKSFRSSGGISIFCAFPSSPCARSPWHQAQALL